MAITDNEKINISGTLVRNTGGVGKIVDGKEVEGGYFVCASKPSSGDHWTTGQLCYCTSDSKFYQYNGTTWVEADIARLGSVDASKVAITDANKKLVTSTITTTELGHLSGITGNIQNKFNMHDQAIEDLEAEDVMIHEDIADINDRLDSAEELELPTLQELVEDASRKIEGKLIIEDAQYQTSILIEPKDGTVKVTTGAENTEALCKITLHDKGDNVCTDYKTTEINCDDYSYKFPQKSGHLMLSQRSTKNALAGLTLVANNPTLVFEDPMGGEEDYYLSISEDEVGVILSRTERNDDVTARTHFTGDSISVKNIDSADIAIISDGNITLESDVYYSRITAAGTAIKDQETGDQLLLSPTQLSINSSEENSAVTIDKYGIHFSADEETALSYGGTYILDSGTNETFYFPSEGGTILTDSQLSVPATVPTLSWNTTTTIGTIAGKALKVKTPAAPSTANDMCAYESSSTAREYPLLCKSSTSTTTTAGKPKFNTAVTLNPSTGEITANSFWAKSDRRLKENIEEFKPQKSILDLPIVKFNFKDASKVHIGCIAQDLQEICPEIVDTNSEGYLSINENKLVYLLLDEVKKLKEEIRELKNN